MKPSRECGWVGNREQGTIKDPSRRQDTKNQHRKGANLETVKISRSSCSEAGRWERGNMRSIKDFQSGKTVLAAMVRLATGPLHLL